MKKIISILLVCVLVFALSACAADSGADGSGKTSNDPEFTINGKTIKLTYETNHKDLFYKESIKDMNRNTAGNVRFIDCPGDDGENLVNIRMIYFTGKTIEESLAGSGETVTEKTVGGYVYTYFEYELNGVKGHTYMHYFEGTTYSICFESMFDIDSLEQTFLGTVRFERSDDDK